jgi:hypothetical protein
MGALPAAFNSLHRTIALPNWFLFSTATSAFASATDLIKRASGATAVCAGLDVNSWGGCLYQRAAVSKPPETAASG